MNWFVFARNWPKLLVKRWKKAINMRFCMLFCVQIMHSRTEQCLFNLLEGALDFIHNILPGYTSNSDWTQIVRLTFPEDLTPFIKQKKMKIQANSKQIRFRILTSPMSYRPSGVSCSWSTCRLWTQIEMTECSCILVPIQYQYLQLHFDSGILKTIT